MRVLTWNLFHGRSVPPAGHPLLREFQARLAEWDWDVALLQETPPWWPQLLAAASSAEQRTALTSRNEGLAFRRAIAVRRPDLIKSNGGGSNAILSRIPILEHHTIRLRAWPERRVAQLARLGDQTVIVNFHASTTPALAEAELERLWREAQAWAKSSDLVLGGDLNLRRPATPREQISHVAQRDVDHLFARGLAATGNAESPDRRLHHNGHTLELSDHAPLLVELGVT